MASQIHRSAAALLVLGLLPLVAACGSQSKNGATSAEPWFRREPSRPAPEPEPAPTIVKKEPGSRDGNLTLATPPAPPAIDADNVLAWRPGSSSDTVTLKGGMSDYTLTGATIQASARTALIAYQGGGPYVGTTLRDCLVHVAPNTVPDDRSFWAIRGYDMSETTLASVEITGFGKVTSKHDEGHAIYLNIVGALTLTDCNIHHNGGQGLQLVNRPYESNLPAAAATGAIEVRRTWFRENGFNPDRGAFQVSIFGTGQDVTLADVEITAGHDATSYPSNMTGGGLLIEAEGPHTDKRNVWWYPYPKGVVTPPFTQGVVVLERVVIDHVNPNRPIAQIKGCRELKVSGCTFNGGKVFLDDPQKPGRTSGRIEWSGNSGNAAVFLNGEQIGTAAQDFTAENGVRL